MDGRASKASTGLVLAIARLRSQANRRVGSAISTIPATLDDLEEESLRERARVELEVLPFRIPVVQDVQLCESLDALGIELEARFKIIIVVVRNRKGLETEFLQAPRSREDVGRHQRDVLHAGTVEALQEARGERLAARRADSA